MFDFWDGDDASASAPRVNPAPVNVTVAGAGLDTLDAGPEMFQYFDDCQVVLMASLITFDRLSLDLYFGDAMDFRRSENFRSAFVGSFSCYAMDIVPSLR